MILSTEDEIDPLTGWKDATNTIFAEPKWYFWLVDNWDAFEVEILQYPAYSWGDTLSLVCDDKLPKNHIYLIDKGGQILEIIMEG